MPCLLRIFFISHLLFSYQFLFSQTYITNGSATQNTCNCYTLTDAVMNQSGSVWNKTKTDLHQPFDFAFNVFLGCGDSPGADGIAFILQTSATSVGRTGSGLGFAGVSPSIGIALDTYQNTAFGDADNDLNDPSYDHISIQANGGVKHGADLANPVPASATSSNIEDCNWHVLRITWNPATKGLEAYFDGELRVGATVDLVNDIFRDEASSVYWGFSASTGGEVNVQQFCTALNPDFSTNFANNGTCIGTPVLFNDQSLSFTKIAGYFWDFGDGTTSTATAPPAHQYAAPGVYPVRLTITGLDGCKSDTVEKQITIGSIPDAAFTVTEACFKNVPQVAFNTTNIGVSYQWLLDGSQISIEEYPRWTLIDAGTHTLERKVLSDYGCGTAAATQPFLIKPAPEISTATGLGTCANIPTVYSGRQDDANTVIQQWNWNFGDGQRGNSQEQTHTYKRAGAYTAKVWALATNGCASDTATVVVDVQQPFADAGRDTIVQGGIPFTLNGRGDASPQWSPTTGLNRTDILTPTAILTNDQQYVITVRDAAGCFAKDSVRIEVFKGSAVYVPNAFTPNGDGRNEVLRPGYKGIKKLYYFSIYNRWGQQVFTTTDTGGGWNGLQGGKPQATGSFVWMLRAEDVIGKIYTLKGTFTLIR